MSGSKLSNTDVFQPVTVHCQTTRLDLPADSIQIRKNGIEFKSSAPFSVWSEMTVTMQTPKEPKRLNFTGVVVACHGNRHEGYMISMVFTDLSRQAQARLNALTYSH